MLEMSAVAITPMGIKRKKLEKKCMEKFYGRRENVEISKGFQASLGSID